LEAGGPFGYHIIAAGRRRDFSGPGREELPQADMRRSDPQQSFGAASQQTESPEPAGDQTPPARSGPTRAAGVSVCLEADRLSSRPGVKNRVPLQLAAVGGDQGRDPTLLTPTV